MADIFSLEKRSDIMSRVTGGGNRATELRLIQIMRRHSITGWRRRAAVFGNPDFIFAKARLAVFVDGCFWHCCPRHGSVPTSNGDFWRLKLGRNRARDRLVTRTLVESGWRVLRIWQHELSVANERSLVRRLRMALSTPSSGKSPQQAKRRVVRRRVI